MRGEKDGVITARPQFENYLESFGEFQKLTTGRDVPWLRNLQEAAFEHFCETGFPTTRDEDWRFTNVSAIARTPFRLVPVGEGTVSPSDLGRWRVSGSACQLVFINGHFAPELSVFGDLPHGVKVNGLAAELKKNPATLEPHLGRYVNTDRDSFCALNTAFFEDGGYVHIPRGTVVEGPICLLFVSTDARGPMMVHPRNLIVAEDDSQATILEDYVSVGGGTAFCNVVTELVAGDQAVISHYMIEREHTDAFNISTLRIQQGRSANIASHSVLMGGGLVRNNVHPVLAGEGGDCLINGLFIGGGTQHIDNYMLVEHASPHCSSRQFYNGILDAKAHGVFHGRIIVHKDAQKTDAKQTNRNLLLSDDAQIDTKPQLEIYADDVKCTHGATIGQIQEDALFYLRSRGLDEVSARKLLLLAFASECLDRMKHGPVRTHIDGLITTCLLRVANAPAVTLQDRTEQAGRKWEEIA